jgi:hypothetical protein
MTREGTLIHIRIYQLLLTHGAKVASSFFKPENGGEKEQTLGALLATAFYSTKFWR